MDISLDLRDPGSSTYRDWLVIDGDLVMTSDTNDAVKGVNPVLQEILQRIAFFAGEWFLDTSQGLPYFSRIFQKGIQLSEIRALFINTILGTPGVTQLLKFDVNGNNAQRILTITFTAQTTQGKVDYSGTVLGEAA